MKRTDLISLVREEIQNALKERDLKERELSGTEITDREEIAKGLKSQAKKFKEKYGKDWKNVMYATATNKAKEKKDASD